MPPFGIIFSHKIKRQRVLCLLLGLERRTLIVNHRYLHPGMKMADGRKTRGKIGQKSEKAKLDKEWNQVSNRAAGYIIYLMLFEVNISSSFPRLKMSYILPQ